MHKNIKEFNLSLDKIHEVHPSHKLCWDHGGKESPAKFDGYHQYGSWLMGLEGDYYTLYCFAYSEFWHSCYPCTRITHEESVKINTEIISLIDKHFPNTGGNIANKTWVYLSYLPCSTWEGVQLPKNITIEQNSDHYRNGSLVKIVMPDPELRTDIDDFWVCDDVEQYLKSTPIHQPEPQYLKHLAFIETEHEEWF